MFISKMVTEGGLILVRGLTIFTINKLSMLVLVPNVSVNSSSVDPLFTIFTLNLVYIYEKNTDYFLKPQIVLKIFLRLQNSMRPSFVFLETPLSLKSPVTSRADTWFRLGVFDCNVTVDIFPSNRNPTV